MGGLKDNVKCWSVTLVESRSLVKNLLRYSSIPRCANRQSGGRWKYYGWAAAMGIE